MTGQSGVSRLSLVLFASLAVNLLLVGYLAGSGFKSVSEPVETEKPELGALGIGASNPRQLFWLLPPQTRRRVARDLRGEAKDARRLFRDALEARRVSFEALTAAPFDADALSQSYEAMRAASSAAAASAQTLVLKLMAALTPDERAALQKAVEEARAVRRERFGERLRERFQERRDGDEP